MVSKLRQNIESKLLKGNILLLLKINCYIMYIWWTLIDVRDCTSTVRGCKRVLLYLQACAGRSLV